MKRLALIVALTVGLGGAMGAAFDADAQTRGRGRDLRGPSEVRDAAGEIVKDGKKLDAAGQKEQGLANAPAVLQRAGVACTVTDALYTGEGNKPMPDGKTVKAQTYEVACQEGLGYLVDRPETIAAAASAPLKAVDCLAAEAGGYQCTLTPKPQRVAYVASIAGTSGRQCAVSDARAMGSNATGSTFYEVACGSAPGYVMEVKGGRVARAIDCLEAAGIGGGCKLTSAQAVLEAKEGQFLQTLRAANVNCQGDEFRLIGKDTRNNRDVVEFKCSDRAGGLVAFIPQQAGGQVTAFDCIEAEGRAIKCQLTTREQIMAQLTRALASENCPVVNYAVLGASATEGEVLEVACTGRSGMIVDMPTSRAKPSKVLTCAQSAGRGGDKCTLPENTRS